MGLVPFRRGKHHARDSADDDAQAGAAEPAAQPRPPAPAGSMDVLLDALNGASDQHDGGEPGERAPGAGEPGEASAGAEQGAEQPEEGRRARLTFRQWRRTRPFWGGVFCLLGGAAITYGPLTVIKFVLVSGTVVWAGVLIGALVCVMGLFMWFSPHLRQVLGVVAAMLSIVSLVTSNFGGFLIGLLLGVTGGAMGFAWTPLPAGAAGVGAEPAAPPSPATGTQAGTAASEAGSGRAGEPAREAGQAAQATPPVSGAGRDPLARARD